MNLKQAAILSTTLVIVFGILMVIPVFLQDPGANIKKRVILTFNVIEADGAQEWCTQLSAILEKWDLPATIFFVGKVAQEHPQSVQVFNYKVDIGSSTFSSIDLTKISDYSMQLEEVERGKEAVDQAGSLNSRIFRAPYYATDPNIYSILSRNNILADFSYQNQYNIYQKNQFIKYNAATFNGESHPPEFFISLPENSPLTIIDFNNSCSTNYIEEFVYQLKLNKVELSNVSEIAGFSLTLRAR